ncbi:MAG: magnesium transporter [Fibrobacterota bacterium]
MAQNDMLLPEEIDRLIGARDWDTLKTLLKSRPVAEIYDLLRLLSEEYQIILFRTLEKERSAELFALMDREEQNRFLRQFTSFETRNILRLLSPDDRTALFSELPSRVNRRMMSLLSREDLRETRELLGYPEESVGRLMTPDYVKIKSEWTVRRAMEHVKYYGRDSETVNLVYVVDRKGLLEGNIRLRTLILARDDEQIKNLITGEYNVYLSCYSDREEAVHAMRKYDLAYLPVVDSDRELVGIVSFDDVMDVAEEEVTEDIQIAASVSPLKEKYHSIGVISLFSKRISWLVGLVVLNIFSSSVVAGFDDKLAELSILFAFVPLLIGAGGNAGNQAATLVIRALVTGDLVLEEVYETVFKELRVSLLLGVVLGLVGGGISLFYSGFSAKVFYVVAISMVAIVITGNMMGAVLPFLLSRLKVDPAVASGPLITTLTDTIGLFIYFSIAMTVI